MPSPPKQSALERRAVYGDLPLSQAVSPARVVAVCGGVSGTGKTTLVTNLGFVLADKGHRVCLLDADTSLSNAAMQLGLSPSYSFADYVQAGAELENALWSVSDGVQLMPGAGRMEDFTGLPADQRQRLTDGLHRLESVFDYVLIDCANGESEAQRQLIQASPFVLLVVTEERQSQREALTLLRQLRARSFDRPVMLVVNQTTNLVAAQATYQRVENVARLRIGLRVHFLGYMESDTCVSNALHRHIPFVRLCPDSMTTHHLEVIAHRLHQVARGTRSAAGHFGAFFDALQLTDEVQDKSPEREKLMRQLDQLMTGMDKQQFNAMIKEIVALWERRTGERFEWPTRLIGESSPVSTTVEPKGEEPPSAETDASISEASPPEISAPGHDETSSPIKERPPLKLVERGPAITTTSQPSKGDGLKAAASVAAKVGSL